MFVSGRKCSQYPVLNAHAGVLPGQCYHWNCSPLTGWFHGGDQPVKSFWVSFLEIPHPFPASLCCCKRGRWVCYSYVISKISDYIHYPCLFMNCRKRVQFRVYPHFCCCSRYYFMCHGISMGDYLLVGQILRSPLTPYEVSTLAVNTRSLHQPYQEKSMKFLELGLSRPSIW